MNKIKFKLLSAFMVFITVISPIAVVSSADTLTADNSSAVREEAIETVLTDEIVWLEAYSSYWNLGYNSQTVIKGKDKAVGDWLELHKTDSEAGGIAASVDNMGETTDITGMHYLEFDFYLCSEALDIFKNSIDGAVELSSSGVCDEAEISVPLSRLQETELKFGWNHIKLDLNTFTSCDGESGPFDRKSLNYFRFYITDNTEALWWYRLSNIKFTKYSANEMYNSRTSKVSGDGSITINDNCITTLLSNTANMGLQLTYASDNYYRDMTGMDYLEFDFYISDANILRNAADLQFEIRSNGCAVDDYELHWDKNYVEEMHLKSGWNYIRFRLDGAATSGDNVFDISKISWFRFYAVGLTDSVASAEIQISGLRFTEDTSNVQRLVLSNCGFDTGAAGATANANHYSLHDCKYSDNTGMFALSLDSVDITDYTFLEFDLWIEDSASLLQNDSAVELTSSGNCDVDEIQFSRANLENLGLQNGWNHLKLSLNDFVPSEQGEFNSKEVNYFRIYFVSYADDLMIDNLCVTSYPVITDSQITGDVTADGNVDARDIVRLKKHLAFVTDVGLNTANSDINDDGSISLIDIIKLRNQLLGENDDLLYYINFDYIKGEFYNNEDTEYDVVNFLFSLQGVLNKEKPTLFVDYIDNTDEFWYDYLKDDQKLLYEYGCKQIKSFDDLIEIFKEEISHYGLVLWDEAVPATANVAATVCAVTGALPVRSGSELQSRLLLNTEVTVKVDLKDKFAGEGIIPDINCASTGSAKCDAYLWAAKRFENEINWSMLGSYVDAYPENVSPDLCLANHDYIISNGGFFFDLSPWSDEVPCDDITQPLGTDYNTLKEILKLAYEHNGGKFGTVCGYTPWPYKYSSYADANSAHSSVDSEHRFVEILSSFNMVLDADSAPHGELSNASVYMHHTLAESYENNRARQTEAYDSNKEYVMIYMGDYDSSAWTARYVPQMFTDEARGEFDITWSFNLNISDRCPMIFDYVYENKTEHDFFSAGNSGVGYVMPNVVINRTDSDYPSGAEAYIDYCKSYLEKFDIDYLGASIATEDFTDSELNMYADMGFTAFAHSRKDQGIVSNERIVGVNFRNLPEGSRDYTWCSKVVSGMIDSYGDRNVLVIRSILWTPTEIKELRNELSSLRSDIVFSCNPENFSAMAYADLNQ